jgi:cytochrome P450
MLFAEGQEWKRARGLFNPGFALSHLMTLVPSIVDDTAVFHQKFGELADSGEVMPIEELLARLTIDIMGHIILDHDLNSQVTENPMVAAFRAQMGWTPKPLSRPWMVTINPVFRFAQWYYTRIMDNYIRQVIRDRLAVKNKEEVMSKKQYTRRPAIDLAVDEYNLGSEGKAVDKEFEQVAIDQMKTFLFAGHDTSSSTLSYVYYLLDLHPEALAKTRAEHERVFGPSKSTGEAIKTRPQLLNELPYTTAVIKGLFPLRGLNLC